MGNWQLALAVGRARSAAATLGRMRRGRVPQDGRLAEADVDAATTMRWKRDDGMGVGVEQLERCLDRSHTNGWQVSDCLVRLRQLCPGAAPGVMQPAMRLDGEAATGCEQMHIYHGGLRSALMMNGMAALLVGTFIATLLRYWACLLTKHLNPISRRSIHAQMGCIHQ
jgi:hypothetical protein